MLQDLGDRSAALKAFRTYQAKSPAADDAWLVQDTINELEGSTP